MSGFSQALSSRRFEEQFTDAKSLSFGPGDRPTEAGHQNDRKVRPDFQEFAREIFASEAGHGKIGDDQIVFPGSFRNSARASRELVCAVTT